MKGSDNVGVCMFLDWLPSILKLKGTIKKFSNLPVTIHKVMTLLCLDKETHLLKV